MAMISVLFDATSNCVSKLSGYAFSHSAASVTNYMPVTGTRLGTTTTEANAENTIKKDGTAKNAYIYISSNARTSDTIIRLRANRASTVITFTIPASTMGIFEDTTNTVSYSVDDEIDWQFVSGTGTGSIVLANFALDYETTNNGFITSGSVGSASDLTVASSVTEYYVIGGANIEATSIETEAQQTARNPFTLSNLTVIVRANTITANTTVKLRINGADATQVISIASGATGFFSDTIHSDILGAGDTIDFQIITGATGTSITISQIAIWSYLGHIAKSLATQTATISESTFTRQKSAWRLEPRRLILSMYQTRLTQSLLEYKDT